MQVGRRPCIRFRSRSDVTLQWLLVNWYRHLNLSLSIHAKFRAAFGVLPGEAALCGHLEDTYLRGRK